MRFVKPAMPPTADVDAPTGLRIIATGLPRCATSSIQSAFESHLSLGPCMHFSRVLPDLANITLVHQAAQEPNKAKRQALLHRLFDGYASSADFPGINFVEDLVEM